MSKHHGKNGKYGAPLGRKPKEEKSVKVNSFFEKSFVVDGMPYTVRSCKPIDCNSKEVLAMVACIEKNRGAP